MTNGERLKKEAAAKGIPLRTLDNVKAALAAAERQGSGKDMSRLMLKHGRLTDDARRFVEGRQ